MKLSSTVISTALLPCTPRFGTYRMFDWLITVPVMNKVDGNMTNYQSGLSSFAVANKSQNGWSFSAHLLPLLEIYFYLNLNQFNLLSGF